MPTLAAQQSTIAAAGTAQVTLGPVPTFTTWHCDRLTVRASAGTPQARVYRGDPSDVTLVDGTYSGALDTSEYGGTLVMQAGEYLTVAWSGGTVGSSVSARLEGS